MFPLLILLAGLTHSATAEFITVRGFEFISQASNDSVCRPYYVTGFNGYQIIENFRNDGEGILQLLDSAQEAGMNVLRFFAHGVTSDAPLQTSPGEYDQSMFEALDRVLVELKKRDMKAILSLSSYWAFTDGPQQYVAWAGLTCDVSDCRETDPQYDECLTNNCPDREKFYSDPRARQLFKDHIDVITSRVNSVSNVAYKDDDTIFSWNLMNEPNCRTEICEEDADGSECADAIQSWIEEMAPYLKERDPNHLVTVGVDGLYGPSASSAQLATNPDAPPAEGEEAACPRRWSSRVGQDFVRNHDLPSIDYAAMHIWPDNWLPKMNTSYMLDFFTRFLDQHITDARNVLGKPLIIEEFGKISDRDATSIEEDKNPFYRAVYDEALYGRDEPLKGSLFWQFSTAAPSGPSRTVLTSDSTWSLITENAAFLNDLSTSYTLPCPSSEAPEVSASSG